MRLGSLLDRPENSTALDSVVTPMRKAVRALVPPGRARDILHGTWLGHPLHPVMVQVPIGAFLSAGILDATGAERPARRLIGVGLAGAVPAAAAGATDWSELHEQQQRVGLLHWAGNLTGLALYAGSLVARGRGSSGWGKGLAFGGLGMIGLSGAIGGHLAYRQSAGPNHAEAVSHLLEPGRHDLGPASEFPDRTPVRRSIGEVPVVVVRNGMDIHVLAARCAHLSGPLDEGEVTDIDGELCLTCPWHKSVFRVLDGTVRHGPATADQPAFRVEQNNGRVSASLPNAG